MEMAAVQTSDREVTETILAIYCEDSRQQIFQEAAHWLQWSLPDMDISYGNHTEYKTPEIAGQLIALGAPWMWDPAQHRVLSYPPDVGSSSVKFRAIGVGSNCIKRQRACWLALAITAEMAKPRSLIVDPEFCALMDRAEAVLFTGPTVSTSTNVPAVPHLVTIAPPQLASFQFRASPAPSPPPGRPPGLIGLATGALPLLPPQATSVVQRPAQPEQPQPTQPSQVPTPAAVKRTSDLLHAFLGSSRTAPINDDGTPQAASDVQRPAQPEQPQVSQPSQVPTPADALYAFLSRTPPPEPPAFSFQFPASPVAPPLSRKPPGCFGHGSGDTSSPLPLATLDTYVSQYVSKRASQPQPPQIEMPREALATTYMNDEERGRTEGICPWQRAEEEWAANAASPATTPFPGEDMPREALATPMTQPATWPRRAGTPSTYVLGQQAHAYHSPSLAYRCGYRPS